VGWKLLGLAQFLASPLAVIDFVVVEIIDDVEVVMRLAARERFIPRVKVARERKMAK
jgi:hypothetical protein